MKKKIIKKINLKLAFQLLIITTIISSVLSVSRYRSSVDMKDSAVIAVPILESTTVNLENIHPAMPSREYTLIVKNFKPKVTDNNITENEIITTEVSMNYKIQIKQLGNLPLKIEIYDSEKNLILKSEDNEQTETKEILMPISETEQEYNLVISWKENYNDYKYNGEISYIKIDVNSVQVD